MMKYRWVVWIPVAGLIVAGCMGGTPVQAPIAQPIPTPEEGDTPEIPANPGCSSQERCRAWLLFKVQNVAEATAKLEEYLSMQDAAQVVIRADVVEGDYNLVVPVDTADRAGLESVISVVSGAVGSDPLVLIVAEHHPDPVTKSHSYVTGPEAEPYPEDFPTPGLQVPNSPGANPWG